MYEAQYPPFYPAGKSPASTTTTLEQPPSPKVKSSVDDYGQGPHQY